MRGTQAELDSLNSAIETLSTLRNGFEVDDGTDPDPEPEPEPDPEQSIRDFAGVMGSLGVVNSQAAIAALGLRGSWVIGNQWSLPQGAKDDGSPWENLDVQGTIYYTGSGPLKLKNVKCQGVQYKRDSLSPGGTFWGCTVVNKPGMTPGQGAIHFWTPSLRDWEIAYCDLSGFADGVQCMGPGLIHHTWVHDFLLTSTTHNDGVQNYGGRVESRDCVFDLGDNIAAMAGHTNGALFTSADGASFEAWNLYVNCPSDPRINALNGSRGPIVVHSGKIKGGALPGDIRLDSAVVRIP